MPDFLIDIFLKAHAEMVVVVASAGYPFDANKAKVVGICLPEGENDVYEGFAQLSDISRPVWP